MVRRLKERAMWAAKAVLLGCAKAILTLAALALSCNSQPGKVDVPGYHPGAVQSVSSKSPEVDTSSGVLRRPSLGRHAGGSCNERDDKRFEQGCASRSLGSGQAGRKHREARAGGQDIDWSKGRSTNAETRPSEACRALAGGDRREGRSTSSKKRSSPWSAC